MHLSLTFTRTFFAVLSILFATAYMFSCPYGQHGIKLCLGLGLGSLFFLLLLGADQLVRKCRARTVNTLVISLLAGYLVGAASSALLDKLLQITAAQSTNTETVKTFFFLITAYLATMLTLRSIQHLDFSFMTSKEKEEEPLPSAKPSVQAGESIRIKIQRYGKEPKQGVGYLDDGTMVVINNGGDFLGEIIDTQVISVKQTSAGKIIFTNALTENFAYDV